MTGVGAVVNAQLKFGESILIVGLGGVGLSAILEQKLQSKQYNCC